MRKLIVVTGGSQGIGRAVLTKFVAQGFDAVTCARNEQDLISMKTELQRQYPEAHLFICATDMSVKVDVQAFSDYALALNPPVDVLVNNAGYFIPGQIISEPDGNLEAMLSANLLSAYHMTRGLVKQMANNRSGHIFNMCSIASFKAYPNGGSYAISKFGLLGMSKCLREELKDYGLRVTAVMPGATRTRSWDMADLPDERFISPQDVAESIFNAWPLSSRTVVEEIIIRPQEGDI